MSGYLPRIVDLELDDLLDGLPAISIEGPRAVGKTETALRRAATVYRLDDAAQAEILRGEPDRLGLCGGHGGQGVVGDGFAEGQPTANCVFSCYMLDFAGSGMLHTADKNRGIDYSARSGRASLMPMAYQGEALLWANGVR